MDLKVGVSMEYEEVCEKHSLIPSSGKEFKRMSSSNIFSPIAVEEEKRVGKVNLN
jgi:hypothetical protein